MNVISQMNEGTGIISNIDLINGSHMPNSSNLEILEGFRTRITPEQVEYWQQYRKNRKQYILRQLKNYFEYLLALEVSLVSATAACIIEYSNKQFLLVILSCISSVWGCFYNIRAIRLFANLKDRLMESTKKRHIWSTGIKNLSLFINHGFIAVYSIFKVEDLMIPIIIIMLCSLLSPFIIFNRSTNSCFSFVRALKFMIGFFRFTIVIIIVLKISGKVIMNSPVIFLPCWLLLFVTMLTFLFAGTVLVFAICGSIKEKKLKQESNMLI